VIGQVVLITGASSVIGRATAKAFAREGARIVISELSDEEGTKQTDQLRSSRVEMEFFRADIRQDEDVQGLVEFTVDRFGCLDAAVNCAETGAGLGQVKEQSPESYAMTFETNVLGTILCLKHELAAMTRRRRGSIVNLSRTAGHRADALAPIYAASKHAVEGLTKSAALEAAAFGIRINAVAAGLTATETADRASVGITRKVAQFRGAPLRRRGTPEDIANAILFLASDRAAFITGHVLPVDGGRSAI
jgi:NAD(P)-dependent dehydrogenase (short-subunit alcohol dehydrogenase family)